MSDDAETDVEAREMLPEEEQQLRTKFRLEYEYAVDELDVDPDASREEIRTALRDMHPWQREELQRKKQRQYDRLKELMGVSE